ncbi:hypothetical protein ABZ714_01495 [Streptomyces sp. NPDC006798]|uniref:hypothetical protein n=1 Tax=Streptomyces sp. NPDC006798 TaxID=3155462 RepID=UPI0033DA5FE0
MIADPFTDPAAALHGAYEADLAPHRALFESAEPLRTVLSPVCEPALFAYWIRRYGACGAVTAAPPGEPPEGPGLRSARVCAELHAEVVVGATPRRDPPSSTNSNG